MDLEKRIAQLSPANLALLEQKLRENQAEGWLNAQPASVSDRPELLPLHGRSERRAGATPDAKLGDAALTYQELNRRVNGVARWLRSQGIDRGSRVGICPSRSLEMVTGLFGILKAGAACMPIEPDFPEERVAAMLNDAQVGHVSTTSRCLPLLSKHDVKAIALDRLEFDGDDGDVSPSPHRLSPAALACVPFTSGSTDQPKSVLVSRGAIDDRLRCLQKAYHFRPGDRVLQKTPYTFDVSGRPISNSQIYILNERLHPSPIGVADELYLGGRNLAGGSLNKPGLLSSSLDESSMASLDALV